MTPHADPFDGKLTLAYGYRGTRLGLFQALPRAFNEDKGSYVEMEGMVEVQATRVSIHLDQAFTCSYRWRITSRVDPGFRISNFSQAFKYHPALT